MPTAVVDIHHALVTFPRIRKTGPIAVWLPSVSPEPLSAPSNPQALMLDGLVVDKGTG